MHAAIIKVRAKQIAHIYYWHKQIGIVNKDNTYAVRFHRASLAISFFTL
jgi:hypothetical protein